VQDVLKRDGYTCLECGYRGKGLEVHHIKPFALIIKENKIITVEQGIDCYELWHYENAVTLCKPCHKKTDTYLKMV
jgi:5-methylcytosine-specific restriction endonuclease McrA